MMFNETTSYFGDSLNPGGTSVWQQLQFGSKASWKQAGRPTSGAMFTPPPQLPIGGVPTPIAGAGNDPSPLAPVATAASSGGIAGLLSSIPTTYLLIGGAIILLMVMKK
jgi:hypothetical protein